MQKWSDLCWQETPPLLSSGNILIFHFSKYRGNESGKIQFVIEKVKIIKFKSKVENRQKLPCQNRLSKFLKCSEQPWCTLTYLYSTTMLQPCCSVTSDPITNLPIFIENIFSNIFLIKSGILVEHFFLVRFETSKTINLCWTETRSHVDLSSG